MAPIGQLPPMKVQQQQQPNDKSSNYFVDFSIRGAMEVLKTAVSVYDIVTYPAYFVIQKPWIERRKIEAIRAVQENPNDPYSSWVRVGNPPPCLADECETIDDVLRASIKMYSDQRCMGVREVLKEEREELPDGKVFIKKILAPQYEWFTYKQVDARIDDVSRGLLFHGIKPGDRVIIFMETRMEWMLTAQGLYRLGATLATLYATLGDEGIIHVVNEIEASHIITSSDLLPKLKKLKPQLTTLKTVIYVEDHLEVKDKAEHGMEEVGLELVRFGDLEKDGATHRELKGRKSKGNDVALIMYTSGSTGAPKGVVAWHSNFVAAIKSFNTIISLIPHEREVYIGYLPLAHNLEFTTEHLLLSMGVPVGYSSPFTLTDVSPAIKAGGKGDINILRPGALAGVPLIMDRLRKGITEKVGSRGKFFNALFKFALSYKNYWTEKGFDTPIINKIFCSKINSSLGGKLQVVFSGGAPLSPDTHLFARACLNVRLMQGFGATETTAITSLMDPYDLSVGRTGAPLYGCKVRLVDWEEGGYRPTDKPNPRGEIVVGGPSIAAGYFKKEKETEEVFREENGVRWFYTGDIGEFFPDGTLKIIDRKKDLLKLQFGEYVSLGKVESELKSCVYVDNVCIYGDSYENNIIGLVVPNPLAVKSLAKKLGSSYESKTLHELFDDEVINEEVLKDLQTHARKAGLHKSEIPFKIKLVKEEWTPDSGLVTAALKIRRKPIKEFYQSSIDAMYGRSGQQTSQQTPSSNGSPSILVQRKVQAKDENGNDDHALDRNGVTKNSNKHIKTNGSVSNGHIKSSPNELDVINENVPILSDHSSH